jgi:hypothetical protein
MLCNPRLHKGRFMQWERTAVERKAIEAQALPSFPINVEEIRRTVSELLTEFWPAPGFEDTELGVFMEPEVDHGETKIYAGVQA